MGKKTAEIGWVPEVMERCNVDERTVPYVERGSSRRTPFGKFDLTMFNDGFESARDQEVELPIHGRAVAQDRDERPRHPEVATLGRDKAKRELAAHEIAWRDGAPVVPQFHEFGMHEGERGRGREASCAEGMLPSAQLSALKQALATHQQEMSLTFPQPDETVVAARKRGGKFQSNLLSSDGLKRFRSFRRVA